MALKDWKKITEKLYQHKYTPTRHLEVYQSEPNKYLVLLFHTGLWPESRSIKQFKTKSQALNFAEAYMREH